MACRDIFRYDELASKDSIRVLDLLPGFKTDTVHCNLRQVALVEGTESPPSYTALSYTWGMPTDPQYRILINGKSFKVRENLLKALQALRSPTETVTLWVDAVCINQGKLHEKNHQVGMMARIYRCARHVRIWLGPASLDSALGMEYMGMLHHQGGDFQGLSAAENDAITALLQRNYWFRIWILQEVLMASDIDIHCGAAALSWQMFTQAIKAVLSHLPTYVTDGPAFHLVDQRLSLARGDYRLTERTLEALIRTYGGSRATDTRDRVFALLSLACDCVSGQSFQADYRLPRFKLLTQVLTFCKPDDTVDFVSVLFAALSKDSDDEDWSRALNVWDRGRSDRPATGPLQGIRRIITRRSRVLVTQYVPEVSTLRDSVRSSRLEALLDLDFLGNRKAALREMLTANVKGQSVVGYSGSVVVLDASNLMMIVNEQHLAVISESEMTAITNPCSALGLHADAECCTRIKCGSLS